MSATGVPAAAPPVRTERNGAVLVITIDRPSRRNAIDDATATALAAGFEMLDADPQLAVGVLTGAPPGFCAGLDLKAWAAGERAEAGDRGFAGLAARPPTKPLIAAVEGFAVGGGFEIVLACDLVVAASDAVFALPEVRRGLIPGAGGLLRLPERVPAAMAMELALTGEPLPAPRAHTLGLVNRLAEPGHALEVAFGLAAAVAAGAPLALGEAKALIASATSPSADRAALESAAVTRIHATADAHEGAAAFAEKRSPRWSGR